MENPVVSFNAGQTQVQALLIPATLIPIEENVRVNLWMGVVGWM